MARFPRAGCARALLRAAPVPRSGAARALLRAAPLRRTCASRAFLPVACLLGSAPLLGLCLLLAAGCGTETTKPRQQDRVGLFGYLFTGEHMSETNGILLVRTRPIDELYDARGTIIRNALVTLWKEGESHTDTLQPGGEGVYYNSRIRIDTLTTYHLKAVIPGGETVTASTTTPHPFRVYRRPVSVPDSMVYAEVAERHPIEIACADPDQVILVDVYCREDWRDARYVYPIGPNDTPQSYSEYGAAENPPRHIQAYFRFRNLDLSPAGRLVSFYGDMMVFYGRYDVGVYAIDENYYSYLYRDHPELSGGVVGGIGVFGSACRAGWTVRVVE